MEKPGGQFLLPGFSIIGTLAGNGLNLFYQVFWNCEQVLSERPSFQLPTIHSSNFIDFMQGLGDPPNMSANLRKSVRNPTAMRSPAMSRRSRGISGGGVDTVSNGDVNSDLSENGEIR